MPRRGILAVALIAAGVPLALSPAFAAGSGNETPACGSGKVWDQGQGKCVPKSSSLDTESLRATGATLAYAGRYGEAIDILELAEDRGDARIYNLLGYAHRKQGHLLIALGYYEEALRIDPDHVLTREYLGEAHLQMGDLASAKQQLSEIGRRAGAGSDEYAMLAKHIADYEAAKG